MKVYKDHQFLVFQFEDGKNVKYDFAKKQAIGKSGKLVTNLKSQLSGISMNDIIKCCEDPCYGQFLKFVKIQYPNYISNVGTILSHVPEYARFEQFFSAGITNIDPYGFYYSIDKVPKGLIRICRECGIKLDSCLVEFYKANPDAHNIAFNLEYTTLTPEMVLKFIHPYFYCWDNEVHRNRYNVSYFNELIDKYGYSAKSLMLYADRIATYEAIDDMGAFIRELCDYCTMMSEISPKFERYPKHFLTTHRIASRNYNRLKTQFEESKFAERIDKNMERIIGNYRVIYPSCTQDIKDEAVQQNNCVASYIKKVIDGDCHILFMRRKDDPDKSLVTMEVRNNKIVQALRKFNYPLTEDQKVAVEIWNRWWEKKTKEGLIVA